VRTRPRKTPARREPKQRRARETVEAVLDAAVRILKREGTGAITTNRIADVAGVSIGSVYQYFPDKRAIFVALHDRHVEAIDRVVQGALVEHAAAPLEDLMRALIDAMVDVHAADPELHELLSTEVPHGADATRAFDVRLRGAFRLALASRADELGRGRDVERVAFVVAQMVDALSHGAVLRRPPRMSLASAKEEAARAVLSYVRG
jgi:AcrR family transcriptional regulator